MARSRETKIELTAYDDLFQTDESREEAKLSKIRDIPISEIDEFPDHGLELMMALFKIVQGMISTIMNAAGFGSAQQTVLPQEIVTAVEDCGFFEYPAMGGHADRRTVYYGAVIHNDYVGIRQVFQAVYLYCHSTRTPFRFCGRAEPKRWQEFH